MTIRVLSWELKGYLFHGENLYAFFNCAAHSIANLGFTTTFTTIFHIEKSVLFMYC